MAGSRGKSSWIIAPIDICIICKKQIKADEERGSWDGQPAHRECIHVRILQDQPGAQDWPGDVQEGDESGDDGGASPPEDDDDGGWQG
jgi:hypothetical protein